MEAKVIYDNIRYLFNCDHRFENSFMFNWESDVWMLTKSGLSVEIEVKISRSDYLADFRKYKHVLLKKHTQKHISVPTGAIQRHIRDESGRMIFGCDNCPTNFIKPCDHIPNRFYFACPQGMININEVPSYAGLIYIPHNGGQLFEKVVKKAPLLHKNKKDWNKKLLEKYYYRNQNARNEIIGFEHQNRYMSVEDQLDNLTRRLLRVQQILR